MDYFIKYWPFILGAAVVMAGYITFIFLPQLRKNDTKNVYQSLAEPKVLIQHNELETDYVARYERERMRYIDSKNRWAIVQPPVIFFPLNAAFEVTWFGEKHHISTIGLTYEEYLIAGVQFQRKLKEIRDKHVYGQFGTEKLIETTRHQKPVNPDRLWQNTVN